MKILFRELSIFLILSVFSFGAARGQSSASPKTKLVLVINVEQMRSDYLVRYADKFQNDGFLRLVNHGAVCSNASMNLHIQKCVTGVPTLMTGAYPDRHGIINEIWMDRLKEKQVDAVEDKNYITVGSDSNEGQRSAKQLLSPTLGDGLKLSTNGNAKVFSVSLNDYSAVLSSGHAADGAYWMDNQTGNMISSSYYVDQFPSWAFSFNAKQMVESFANRDWTTLLPMGSYEASVEDDNTFERGYYEKWNTFPYDLKKLISTEGSYRVLKTTPYGNRLIKDFAVNLIENERLGRDDVPDLLTINFSSMDFANNLFGPSSVEMEDTYLRLDQDIAGLLDYVDKNIGLANTLVILTSSCSSSYSVDFLQQQYNMPAGYVSPESMVALLKSYLNITYGQGNWVEFVMDQQIYFNRQLIEKQKISIDEFMSKAASFINQFEGVKIALPSSGFEQGDYATSLLTTISKSYNFKRSGDILFMLEDGWQPQFKYRKVVYTDNTHIPMIWMGSGIHSGRYRGEVDAIDMVPTIFDILGYDIPSHCSGRVIEEILR
ncbi:alkaline phosphatase family protein [Mangrovibacterium diazotrophicum]|uniref:Type I phosphodiesterase/nucleotide pyrophosphatase n=1 Tax=Mangrovibacterium diazotrophicum TaxID=1261403 RepID=A0A419W6E7_9BACT|nr:alkaline phosphatase family protein [Mangrovibacterium diazotrophicum]RKD91029.1 type I phosphodiesterase/nucleotide pyrophosphatase [Mangrovibacterium diazotrophicum]